ncbi:MAG: hypothetical protein EOP49_18825, partial [Sphingobacteriales bacterium]
MKINGLDTQLLEDYLDGKLDAKAMHFVEREALEDPFMAEALEGLSKTRNRTQTLSILQRQLHERVAQKPVQRKLWGLTTHRLSIAATAAVLFVSASLIFWMVESQKRIAAEKGGKVVDVELMATAPAAPSEQSGVNSPESIVNSPESGVQSLKSKVSLQAVVPADKTDVIINSPTIANNKAIVIPRPEVSARYSKSSISGYESGGVSAAADAKAGAVGYSVGSVAGNDLSHAKTTDVNSVLPGASAARPTVRGVVIGQDNLPIAGVAISSGTGKPLT